MQYCCGVQLHVAELAHAPTFPGRKTSSTVAEHNSTAPTSPRRKIFSAATAIDDDRFLVAGGFTLSALSWCYLYDTRSEEWSTWPSLNIGRNSHVSVYTHNNKAYVIDGYNSNGDPLDSIEELFLPEAGEAFHNDSRRNVLDAAPLRIPRTPATILLLLVTTTTATPSVVARRSVWTKHKKDNQER